VACRPGTPPSAEVERVLDEVVGNDLKEDRTDSLQVFESFAHLKPAEDLRSRNRFVSFYFPDVRDMRVSLA
jgi:hypothetical protein